MSKSKIGLAVFEIKGTTRKKLFEYSTTPGNHKTGLATINMKFGMALKEHSEKIAKKMRY